MALGLRKSGCSVGASLAYWIGNPILNPATMVFMGFVLGWQWVGLRLGVGLLLVFGVAYLAHWLVGDETPANAALVNELTGGSGARAAIRDDGKESIWTRWLKALWQLSVGLIPEYTILVLLLGAARAWLFPAVTPEADGLLWMLGLSVAGTLFVIPTAGEIPIVQTLMAYGLGTGPAAALLTTLPPVSLPSLVMLGRGVPARVLVGVVAVVTGLGVLSAGVAVALGF